MALQIKLKTNQFGVSKGCSIDELLGSILHEIGTALKDNREDVLLTENYYNTLNRLSYHDCFCSLARLGAGS